MWYRRGTLPLLTFAIFSLLLAACGGDDPTPTPRATATPVPADTPSPTATPTPAAPTAAALTIALPPVGIQAIALHTALEGGFFEKHGLDVTLTLIGVTRDVMRAVRLGDADLAVLPPIQIVMSLSSPRPLVAIGAVSGASQLNVVLAGGIAAKLGVTADSSLAERLGVLEGLKVAHPLGPLGVVLAGGVLEAAGLVDGEDAELVPVRGEDQPAALAAGEVDAFLGHHPYLEEVIVGSGAILLVHLTGGDLPELGAFPNLVLAISPDDIGGKREQLAAVLAALEEAQQAIANDPSVATAALRAVFPDISDEALAVGVAIYAPGVPATPFIAEEAYRTALQAFGLGDTPFERVIDNSLIEP